MSERSYAPGTPCWIDLGTPDQDASAAFYGGLLGWTVEPGENPEETGGYREARLDGSAVGGIMNLMQEGQPPAWLTYVASADADATADAARRAGGSVLAEPVDVLDFGRMAVLADPAGAVFGIWQAGKHHGFEVVNEPGSPTWTELNIRDVAGAREFYGAVFGWDLRTEAGVGDVGAYTTVMLNGDAVAGVLDQDERGVPAEIPAYWTVYFAVEDTDAAVARARDLGASVMLGPIEVPAGRFAILVDPQGANFALIALSAELLEANR